MGTGSLRMTGAAVIKQALLDARCPHAPARALTEGAGAAILRRGCAKERPFRSRRVTLPSAMVDNNAGPQAGDIVVRGSFQAGFEVLEALTLHPVVEGVRSISEAIHLARERGAAALWHLNTDDRGRALGPPLRLPVRSS